jgi:hypothetical protein
MYQKRSSCELSRRCSFLWREFVEERGDEKRLHIDGEADGVDGSADPDY